ncbi:MAG: hypothetical protein ABI779_24165 [Acidobacteriota bacterium]
MKRVPLAALVLLAAAAVSYAAPRARMRADGEVEVLLPETVLARKEVARQLTSGLTTAFVLRVEQRKLSGGARVEIRYDLWEETYLITVLEFDGRIRKAKVAAAKLAEWWRGAALRVLRTEDPSESVETRLQVLPFSAREEADTERWLSESVGASPKKNATTDPRSSANALLDAIIGTSVQRRPILEFRWSLRIEALP